MLLFYFILYILDVKAIS